MKSEGSTGILCATPFEVKFLVRKFMMRTLKQQQDLYNLTLVRVLVQANKLTDSHIKHSSYGILLPLHNFIFKYFGN